MTKAKEQIEEALENIAYAEAGEYGPRNKKTEEADALEDILTAIGMAEGGDEDFAKRLHPLFRMRQGSN